MAKKKEVEEVIELPVPTPVEEVVVDDFAPSYVGQTLSVNGHKVLVASEIVTEKGVLVKDAMGVTYLI